MADTIDVDKLKNDAFDAIDALFGDDDNESSIGGQLSGDAAGVPDEFAMLDEYSLALDWEYSDKEINRFNEALDNIARKKADKYNQALIKMLKSIINYLQKARNKAFPQTLSVMSSVIDVLKKINAPDSDKDLIKSEVGSAYQKVVILKQKISEYNEELKKYTVTQKMDTVPDTDAFESAFESVPEEDDVETIYSYDLIDDEATPEEQDPDIFSEMVSSEDFSSSFTIDEDEATPSETGFILSEPGETLDPEGGILDRLIRLEEKVASLEQQNQEFRRRITEKQSETEVFSAPSFDSLLEEHTDTDLGVDEFSSEDNLFTSIDEPLMVDVDEISYASAGEEISQPDEDLLFESPGTNEEFYDESYDEGIEDISLPSDEMDYAETEQKEDFIEYVRFFMVGQQVVALPNDYINNIYKLPSGIQKNIHSLTTITLEELSSVFQKLSKNMKGALQDIPGNELNEITATVKIIGTQSLTYRYGVLCSCDDTHVIVPITDKHRTKLKLATGMSRTNTEFSEYSVEIDGMGSVPLVIPC